MFCPLCYMTGHMHPYVHIHCWLLKHMTIYYGQLVDKLSLKNFWLDIRGLVIRSRCMLRWLHARKSWKMVPAASTLFPLALKDASPRDGGCFDRRRHKAKLNPITPVWLDESDVNGLREYLFSVATKSYEKVVEKKRKENQAWNTSEEYAVHNTVLTHRLLSLLTVAIYGRFSFKQREQVGSWHLGFSVVWSERSALS